MTGRVPVIDLAGWSSASNRPAIAAEVDRAASTVGFMQVVGHGIPAQASAALADAMDEFFALPLDWKSTYKSPRPEINRGYSPPRSEALSYSLGVESPADLFEAYNLGAPASDFPGLDLPPDHYPPNTWPDGRPGFRTAVETWFGHVQGLAHVMTSAFALALGLPEGFFEPYTDHSIDMLRLNFYSAPPHTVLEPGQLGMGPHTDYGIVTVLWCDGAPGLQILGPDGGWSDVEVVPGALLINLGDLLARWTSDRWLSTMHRVKAPIDERGIPYRRRSAAFFHDGNADALIRPLGADGRGEPYPPVLVADHLAAKLAGSRGLTPNRSAVRESARLPGGASTGVGTGSKPGG